VQVRLHVPLGDVRARHAAVLRVLAKTVLAGTGARSASEVAAGWRRIGALVDADADVDWLVVSASAPADELDTILAEVAAVVAQPSFPSREVVGERERAVQEVVHEAATPGATATRALAGRLYGRHPYAEPLPEVAAVRRLGRATLAHFCDEHVQPAGSVLVVVGDLDTRRVAETADGACAVWGEARRGGAAAGTPPAPPSPGAARGVAVVDRPGAVQSNVRIGARCATRHDADFPALALAVSVFGGHFTSRLVANLRERHGYTYSPRAAVRHRLFGSELAVMADVGTEVTAPALRELRYELARMATEEVPADELDAARRYVTGSLAMSASTQAGLATLLAALVSYGLEPGYLERYARDLAAVDAGAVQAAAARYLGPARVTTAIVGDAALVAGPLSALDEVTVGE
jgi:predicted Zn-dependent peptidase